MAIKIAFSSIKGGSAKTTTCLCLADALQRRGKRVLLIDCDAQASSSSIYGQYGDDGQPAMPEIMYEGAKAEDCIRHTELGDIIPATNALTNADARVPFDADRYYHLIDSCKGIEDFYDYILADCGPGDGVCLGCVFCYVNYIIAPIQLDRFGVQGLYNLPDVMQMYSKRINPDLKLLGVLIIKYKGRQNLTKNFEENLLPDITSKLGTIVFDTKIRESVRCQEAQVAGLPLYTYAPHCTTVEDYEAFTDELLKRLEG